MEGLHPAAAPFRIDPLRARAGIGAEQAEPDGIDMILAACIVGDMFEAKPHCAIAGHSREAAPEHGDIRAEFVRVAGHVMQQRPGGLIGRTFRDVAEGRQSEGGLDGPV